MLHTYIHTIQHNGTIKTKTLAFLTMSGSMPSPAESEVGSRPPALDEQSGRCSQEAAAKYLAHQLASYPEVEDMYFSSARVSGLLIDFRVKCWGNGHDLDFMFDNGEHWHLTCRHKRSCPLVFGSPFIHIL